MSLQHLLMHFGSPTILLIVFFGVMLEGETFVVLAGLLAHQGYFPLWLVVLTAALGSFIADQVIFHIGYAKGDAALRSHVKWRSQIERVTPWLHRYGSWLVLGFRFLYGLRTPIELAFGLAKYSPRKFVLLNGIGALAWATLISGLAYMFGHGVQVLLGNLKHAELWVIVGVTVIGLGIWLLHGHGLQRLGHQKNLP